MRSWTRVMLALGAALGAVATVEETQASCAKVSVDTAVDSGMRLLVYALNTGTWADLARDKDLDPYEPDEKIKFSIPCKYFGSALCGAQASSCKKSEIHLTLSDILGLAALRVDDMSATAIDDSDGTCPFAADASIPAENLECGFSGNGQGRVSVPDGASIQVHIRDMALKVQCKNALVGKTWWETPLKSSRVSCDMGSGAAATAKLSYCGATCNKSLLSTSFTHASFQDFSFTHYDKALSCSASGISDKVSKDVMRAIQSAVIGMLNKPIQDILNKILAKELKNGFPKPCKPRTA